MYSLESDRRAQPKVAPANPPTPPPPPPPPSGKTAAPRLSMVVLPFENIGGDPEQG